MDTAPILICYDGSDEAQRAIDRAAGILGPRSAVVLDVGALLTVPESIAMTSAVVPGNAFMELNESDARSRAEEGAEAARMAGFDAHARADITEPTWESIVEIADEIDTPVIVMGTRALTGVHELLEGSVSHDVVTHSGRPVLIVPPRKG